MMERIAVAMSGGVDSTTAAFLLKREGMDVIGVHFITGHEPPKYSSRDLDLLSERLHIPIHVVDLKREFQTYVIDYFTETYRAGQTPNPCLTCNARIKFGVLLEHARRLGATALATGHYARIDRAENRTLVLRRGIDPAKDQSYFLAFLTARQLGAAMFPLGAMSKRRVTALALENGLMKQTPFESQDVCFIHGRTYAEFIMHHSGLVPEPGWITDLHGRPIGRHQGLHRFTIGQRKGINCPSSDPFYVIRIDVARNTLVVGAKKDLHARGLSVRNINWIERPSSTNITVQTRIRYRHRAASSHVIIDNDGQDAVVLFDEPQEAVTPGQAAVFYRDDVVLGGGVIQAPIREETFTQHADPA